MKTLQCAVVELVQVEPNGEDGLTVFSGLLSEPKMCSLVLCAPSSLILDEVERSVHDVLCVIKHVLLSQKVIGFEIFSETSFTFSVGQGQPSLKFPKSFENIHLISLIKPKSSWKDLQKHWNISHSFWLQIVF